MYAVKASRLKPSDGKKTSSAPEVEKVKFTSKNLKRVAEH